MAKAVDAYLEDGGFDSFLCYKFQMNTSVLRFGLEDKAAKMLAQAYDQPTGFMNYVSATKNVAWLVFIDRCAKRAKHFYQYVVDPLEADLGKVFEFDDFERLYYNKQARAGAVVMPFYEYMLDKHSGEKSPKSSPFTFYCTALTDERAYMADMQGELEGVEGWDVNICTKDQAHRSLSVGQDEYLSMLKQATASLVIRPYDHEAFSWTRFCECVYNDCVPLVWHDCNFQDVETLFPAVARYTKGNLLVESVDGLRRAVDHLSNDPEAAAEALRALKSGIAEKHVLDIQWLRDRWQKLPGIRGE